MTLNVASIFPVTDATNEFFQSDADESLRPKIVIKSTDQSRINSTVMTNDTELFMSLSADKTYEFELFLAYSNAGVDDPGIKIGFSAPTGSIGSYYINDKYDGVISTWYDPTEMYSNISMIPWLLTDILHGYEYNGGRRTGLYIHGSIKTGNVAGNLQFMFAQNITDADATTVYAGSILKIIIP